SPSLQAAALMSRILPQEEFTQWINQYYTEEGLQRLMELPVVSDRNDYQIVHLDGLSFSRAWCMLTLAEKLPPEHVWVPKFRTAARHFIRRSLAEIFNSHYGGGHWLASFAVYALSVPQ